MPEQTLLLNRLNMHVDTFAQRDILHEDTFAQLQFCTKTLLHENTDARVEIFLF